jgi:hypothetical protein
MLRMRRFTDNVPNPKQFQKVGRLRINTKLLSHTLFICLNPPDAETEAKGLKFLLYFNISYLVLNPNRCFFRAFSSVVRQITRKDGARTVLSNFFFSLLCMFRFLYSVYCLCVNVYCTAATGCQPNVYLYYCHRVSTKCSLMLP